MEKMNIERKAERSSQVSQLRRFVIKSLGASAAIAAAGQVGAVAAELAGASDSGEDPYAAAHPPAGMQPRRPAGYVPYKYPDSPKELLRKYGPAMAVKAKSAWAAIEKVNADGPYKNTYESLAGHRCPEWYKDAKIGMFIDWGPWSVAGYSTPPDGSINGGAYPDWYEKRLLGDDEWHHGSLRDYHIQTWGTDITDDDLINLLSDRHYSPSDYARLAKEVGFRYVVPFLKHHGGFSLWESCFTRRNSMDWKFHRDFAMEFRRACATEGLRFGIYCSLGEWDYPAILPDGQIGHFGFNGELQGGADLSDCPFMPGKIPVQNYVRDYMIPSIHELISKTKPDLIWYDGEWDNVSSSWHTRDLDGYYYNVALREKREVCINDRWGDDARKKNSTRIKVDFATSEHGYGSVSQSDTWEECRSFSHNFGYNWTEESDPNAILSDKGCIELLVDVIGRGGNLLLVVSPTGTGEIPPRQLLALRNMGDWLKKHGQAIYGTRAFDLEKQPEWGRISHSKDGSTIYLLVTHWPADGQLNVPPIPIQRIKSVQLMHGEGAPGFCQPDKRGAFMVDLSACTPGDPRVSVVEIETK